MLSFIKENSYNIFKMVINQIVMTVFGLALMFATQNHSTLFLITSVFSAVFYMFLLYTMTWDCGFEQSRAIESGKKKFIKGSGAYMALLANALNIILAVLLVVGFASSTEFIMRDAAGEITENAAEAVSRSPSAPEWSTDMYGVSRLILVLVYGMYNGIVAALPKLNPWIFLALPLPAVAVCGVAYPLGVRGRHLTKLLGQKPSLE